MMQIREEQPVVLKYDPWRASRDPNNKEINEVEFSEWYWLMMITIKMT